MPNALTEAAVAYAVSKLGVREKTRNSGPEIDFWLAGVGLDPGNEWCAAFGHGSFRASAGQLGMVNPFPRSGRCLRVWALADRSCRILAPVRGAVYVLDHGGGKGHLGIIEAAHPDGTVTEISGNTNRDGSRTGDSVWRHTGDLENVHGGRLLGFLDFALAVQPPRVA